MSPRPLALSLSVVTLVAATPFAGAQSIAERAGTGTRTIAFAAASRAGVCGDGKNFLSDGLGTTRVYEGYFVGTTSFSRSSCSFRSDAVRSSVSSMTSIKS